MKIKIGLFSFGLWAVIIMLSLNSCRKEDQSILGPLDFSEDTISFDTLFTTFLSPTQRLMFYNPSNRQLLIEEIYVEGGEASDFSIIVDGIEMQRLENFELNAKDSAIVFIKMKSTEMNTWIQDHLVFKSGTFQQKIVLRAFILDAYFYSMTDLPCNMVFDETKPYVIDGIVRIGEGCVLTIMAGAQIYFTARKDANFNLISMLDVQGSLQVDGTPMNKVIFSSTRFDGEYPETGAQWRGIRIGANSTGSYIHGALIKNGLFGIEVDSFANNFLPKVRIRQTEIRNMAAYGIWALGFGVPSAGKGPMIHAENVLVHNCQQANFAMVGGGDAIFLNSTFANYSIDFSRQSSQIGILSYWEDSITTLYPAIARFYNCIVWGSEEEEVVLDSVPGYPGYMDVEFHSCILKTTQAFQGSDIRANVNPIFENEIESSPADRKYHLKSTSPALNTGVNLSTYFNTDLDGFSRDANFDLGCYEFRP